MHTGTPRFPRWLATFAVLCLGLACALAATPAKPTHTDKRDTGNRWLVILDTSKGMQRRAPSMSEHLCNLIYGGVQGQMREGDTLGMWNYDAELHTGVFPLEVWAPNAYHLLNVSNRIAKFIKDVKFQKTANFDTVLPTLDMVIKDSRVLTILIYSDGLSKIRGTPFDTQLAEAYATWAPEQQKARKPVLTVLRAEHGKITHFTVAPVPWQLDLPPLPPPEVKPVVKATTSNAPPIGKPLIVTGKKPEPVPTPAPAITPTATPPAVPSTATTPAPAATSTAQASTPAPDPVPSPAAAPAATPAPAETKPKPAQPPPLPLADPVKPEPANASSAKPTPKLPERPAPSPAPQSAEVTNRPPAAEPASEAAPETATATVVPEARSGFFSRGMLIGVSILGLGLVFLVWLAATRRGRPEEKVSLITRSIDRDSQP